MEVSEGLKERFPVPDGPLAFSALLYLGSSVSVRVFFLGAAGDSFPGDGMSSMLPVCFEGAHGFNLRWYLADQNRLGDDSWFCVANGI